MTMEEKIARINALARKAKAEGLTDDEREEQAQLRRDYIDSVKANLKSQLDSLYVLAEKSGKKTNIIDFERERAARAGEKRRNSKGVRNLSTTLRAARFALTREAKRQRKKMAATLAAGSSLRRFLPSACGRSA